MSSSSLNSTIIKFSLVRACIFDVDELLINSEDIYIEIYNNILHEYDKTDYFWSVKARQQSRDWEIIMSRTHQTEMKRETSTLKQIMLINISHNEIKHSSSSRMSQTLNLSWWVQHQSNRSKKFLSKLHFSFRRPRSSKNPLHANLFIYSSRTSEFRRTWKFRNQNQSLVNHHQRLSQHTPSRIRKWCSSKW